MHRGGDYFRHLSFYVLYTAMITTYDVGSVKQTTMNDFCRFFLDLAFGQLNLD